MNVLMFEKLTSKVGDGRLVLSKAAVDQRLAVDENLHSTTDSIAVIPTKKTALLVDLLV